MVKHYLISLPLGPMWMHCYLMSNDPSAVEGAANRMLKVAEENGVDVRVPLFMSTALDPAGARSVRKLVRDLAPDAGKTLREATDFHVTIWAMPDAEPLCKTLVAMH